MLNEVHIPFAALEIADGVREHETVARANPLYNTVDYIIFSAT